MVKGITHDKHQVEFWVDDEDVALLELNWYASFQKSGKLGRILTELFSIKTGKRLVSLTLHRTVMGLKPRDPRVVDHQDGNPANNCRSNLRVCTQSENTRNKIKPYNNTSGYKGVSWHKTAKKWQTQIQINKKPIYLGLYNTPEEAYAAYCQASEKYHGEYGRTE